jgi:hypothetical protein
MIWWRRPVFPYKPPLKWIIMSKKKTLQFNPFSEKPLIGFSEIDYAPFCPEIKNNFYIMKFFPVGWKQKREEFENSFLILFIHFINDYINNKIIERKRYKLSNNFIIKLIKNIALYQKKLFSKKLILL